MATVHFVCVFVLLTDLLTKDYSQDQKFSINTETDSGLVSVDFSFEIFIDLMIVIKTMHPWSGGSNLEINRVALFVLLKGDVIR